MIDDKMKVKMYDTCVDVFTEYSRWDSKRKPSDSSFLKSFCRLCKRLRELDFSEDNLPTLRDVSLVLLELIYDNGDDYDFSLYEVDGYCVATSAETNGVLDELMNGNNNEFYLLNNFTIEDLLDA